ncbi:Hint domain-containing protein [Paracoccus cavernae]|uniref:Hint domain-containing protein n=1 Tax=Paracoccus cavernae TaxID=1571207 RepID=UPI0035F2494D
MPNTPTAIINTSGTIVSGAAEPSMTIEVRTTSGELVGTTRSDPFGRYSITTTRPFTNGEQLFVTATDSFNNTSSPATAFAPDVTPPAEPSNLSMNQDGTAVIGQAEPNTVIEVRNAEGSVIGQGLTDMNGNFMVSLAVPQQAGQTLSVRARDSATLESQDVRIQAPNLSVPCFTAGTMIRTPEGERAVETLAVGDLILTLDNGPQPLRWTGRRKLERETLAGAPNLLPIRISAGALGENTPARDLVVSPQHRILVRSRIAAELFGATEVLVAAKQLLALDGIEVATDCDTVTYVHLLFDRHEVVTSDGAETETLYTGAEALKSVGATACEEIFTLFPQLRDAREAFAPARPFLKGREARELADHHLYNNHALIT